jgi:hypothetical protein
VADAPQIVTCGGCGATATPNGRPLDNRCTCGPKKPPDWTPVVTVLELARVSTFDKVAQHPNVYAKRVQERFGADAFYLRLQAESGHAVAASATCLSFGHDGRAGACMRCGQRLGRAA